MSRDKINLLIEIIKTMEDEDKIEFLNEYEDIISTSDYSIIASSMSNQEYLSKYVRFVAKNIYDVIREWNKIDDDSCDVQLEEDSIVDISSFEEDNFVDIALFEEDNADKDNTIGEIINDVMFAISKVNNEEKVDLISILIKKVMPSIRFFCGKDKFMEVYEANFCLMLCEIVESLSDSEVARLLNNVEDCLLEREKLAVYSSLKSEEIERRMLESSVVPDYFKAIVCGNSNNQGMIEEYINCNLELLEELPLGYEDDANSIINNIVLASKNIKNDDLLEEIIDYYYETRGIILVELFKFIRNDNRKIGLLDYFDIDLDYNDGECIDIISSIKCDSKFRELYDKLEKNAADYFAKDDNLGRVFYDSKYVKTNRDIVGVGNDGLITDIVDGLDSDCYNAIVNAKIDLIVERGDKKLAVELLEIKYNELKKQLELYDGEFDIVLLEQINRLMGVIDREMQLVMYSGFSKLVSDDDKALFLLAVKDNEVKREFVRDFIQRENEKISNYVLERKLYS